MANNLQAHFVIAILLLSHFPSNQGISPEKQKMYDTLISAGQLIEAIGLAREKAAEYYSKLNSTQLNIISIAQTIANSLGLVGSKEGGGRE